MALQIRLLTFFLRVGLCRRRCRTWKQGERLANGCDRMRHHDKSPAMIAGLASLENATLISQGAEAKIYKSWLYEEGPPILLKHRFSKQYRHRQLDSTLTKQRLSSEARALVRCLKFGVLVPGVRYVDLEHGILGLEWIDGMTVRRLLGDIDTSDLRMGHPLLSTEDGKDGFDQYILSSDTLMEQIGETIAKMHLADIIHGDLTTSNMMVRNGVHKKPEF